MSGSAIGIVVMGDSLTRTEPASWTLILTVLGILIIFFIIIYYYKKRNGDNFNNFMEQKKSNYKFGKEIVKKNNRGNGK